MSKGDRDGSGVQGAVKRCWRMDLSVGRRWTYIHQFVHDASREKAGIISNPRRVVRECFGAQAKIIGCRSVGDR
jgi:hypothetical protein